MALQRDPRSHPGAFVGRRLQRARVKAGYSSQEAFASRLHVERTTVAKAESGERIPTPDLLAVWCELTGLDPELFSDLCELARTVNLAIPEWFKPWLDVEAVATYLRIWQPMLIPGLFHTEAYARAILAVNGGDVDALVKTRLERSKILDRDNPPDVVAVIDEHALRRMIGSPETMAEQLAQLVEASHRPNVVIQMVPAAIGAHAGLGGPFDIATAEGASDLLRMETVPQDITTESRPVVKDATVAFDQIRADSLSRGQSRDLIARIGEELWTPKA